MSLLRPRQRQRPRQTWPSSGPQAEGADQALLRQVAALQGEVGRLSTSAAAAQNQGRALQELVRLLEGEKGRLKAEADKDLKRAQQRHAEELQSVF